MTWITNNDIEKFRLTFQTVQPDDCAPLKFSPLVYIWISVKFWEEYRYFYYHLAVQTRDISKPIRLYTNKSHVDLQINLPFTVLQYWLEADERIDKPLTTSNNREYPLMGSNQEMLDIIKRLQISTLLTQIFWNSNWPDRKQKHFSSNWHCCSYKV